MQLVAAVKDSAENVLSRRMLVTFSPRDTAQVEQFEAEGKAAGRVSHPFTELCEFFSDRALLKSCTRNWNQSGNKDLHSTQQMW